MASSSMNPMNSMNLASYRVYLRLPNFMEYRYLELIHGSTTFNPKMKEIISKDWLLKEDFEDIIFRENYVIVEMVDVNGITIYMFIFADNSGAERNTDMLKKSIRKLIGIECRIIFVTRNGIDDNRVNNLRKKNVAIIDNYRYSWLLNNPLEHVSVPHMEIIDQNERDEVLNWIRRESEALTRIRVNDNVNVYLNASPGDIIRIRRTAKNGEFISYSLVE